jgi:DNA repair protein RecO (recombination protein O)
MLISSEGIVLKQRKIPGNRRMIVIFTKNYGKISAGTGISERSKGKSALALRPFTYANYELFRNKGYYNINGADTLKSFYSIGEDIDRFMTASKVIEYLDRVLEEEKSMPRLFGYTLEFFEAISKADSNHETILYAYLVKTLALLGIMPELDFCVDCGKKRDVFERGDGKGVRFFSVTAGGIVCDDCGEREKNTVESLIFEPDFDIVTVLRYFLKNPISHFGRVGLKPSVSAELKRVLSGYLNHYLNVDILDSEVTMG